MKTEKISLNSQNHLLTLKISWFKDETSGKVIIIVPLEKKKKQYNAIVNSKRDTKFRTNINLVRTSDSYFNNLFSSSHKRNLMTLKNKKNIRPIQILF